MSLRSIRAGLPSCAAQGVFRLACLTVVAMAAAVTAAPAGEYQPVSYNFDIRPILVENCFACHGPDPATREAGLRLDDREEAIAMSAFEPGNPDRSELVYRVLSEYDDEVMPPPHSHKTLSAEEKDLLVRWIEEGAEYEPHWSFVAPQRPEPPTLENAEWVRNPIDAFLLAELEAAGLEPAPEADRRTVARRLSLDLIGLPPTVEEVEAFAADESPEYYENYVERLLDSPHWGEHRARYWLDAARYADTHGIHFDNYREIWAYRDWVIEAFNRNLPFDRFTVEQLAGDLLPDPTLDQLIATGFGRCNITTNEGGVIAEEYAVLYTRDRTETTSQVWLGLTAGCAVCHDHKYDPLSQREVYELSAFFNNTTQDPMDGNIKDTPPVVPVPMQGDRPRWFELAGEIADARDAVDGRREAARPEFAAWLESASGEAMAASIPAEDLHLYAALIEGAGQEVRIRIDDEERCLELTGEEPWQPGPFGGKAARLPAATAEVAGAGDFDREQPFTAAAWIKLAEESGRGAIVARMNRDQDFRGWDLWVQGRRAGMHLIERWPEVALKVVANEPIPADTWTHVAVSYDGSGKAAGVRVYYDGKPQEVSVESDQLGEGDTRTDAPLTIGRRHEGDAVADAGLFDLRVYRRGLAEGEVEALARGTRLAAVLDRPTEERSEDEVEELSRWWLAHFDEEYQALAAALSELEAERETIRARGTVAHVMEERDEPPKAYVLFRGEYDQRREEVGPGTPAFLPPLPDDAPRNRLGFAQWLLTDEHPLTARVTVNRFWQEIFGMGLVETAGDFGIAGETPSHPDLLDWLAVEFRESGWDVKHLFRLMVTSAAYRQAAVVTDEKLERDPENRLVSRGPRFRMDAEMIRDYALASSGLLVPRIGGPSVKPYQPDGVWEAVAMIGSDTREYRRGEGEDLYRRSLYTFWKRSAPPASMEIFNAPSREFCVVRRDRTNTPLQALVTLNDVQFVEAARHLAQSVLRNGYPDDEARLDALAHRLLARPLRCEERDIVHGSLTLLAAHYENHPEDARKLIALGESPADPAIDPPVLAAWTMVANQLLNLDEVLNK